MRAERARGGLQRSFIAPALASRLPFPSSLVLCLRENWQEPLKSPCSHVCVCVCVCVCKYVETLKLCCFGGSAAPLPSLLVDYFDVLLPQEEGASHGFRLDLFCSGKGEAWLPLPLAFRSPRCRFFFFFPMKTHSLPIGAFCSRSSQNLPYLSSAETF